MQSLCSKNTATFIVNNISFLSVSSLVIFSLSVFLAMEMKQIPFTDNPVYNSLDVSRYAESSKNSTFGS